MRLAAGVRSVGVVAGQLAADPSPVWAISLEQLAGSTDSAIHDPLRWLYAAGVRAAASAP
jgi:hypothetical protein